MIDKGCIDYNCLCCKKQEGQDNVQTYGNFLKEYDQSGIKGCLKREGSSFQWKDHGIHPQQKSKENVYDQL
jgi:hypothetical protein